MPDRHARHRRRDVDPRRRPVDGFRVAGAPRFARLVAAAMDALPDDLLAHLDDYDLAVADVPPPEPGPSGEVRLGALTPPVARAGAPPSRGRLTLYRRPLEARAHSSSELADLVRGVVVTELADHLGFDDDRLDELGWN